MRNKNTIKLLTALSLLTLGFALWSFRGYKKAIYTSENGHYKVFKTTQDFANIYLLDFGGQYLLIDSGSPGGERKLESWLGEIGVSPEDIDYLILTHGHPDHAGSAYYFQHKYDLKIIAGNGDNPIINQSGRDTTLCPTGIVGRLIQKTIAQKRYSTFRPDIVIDSTFELHELGLQVSVIPVPGHTPGSLIVKVDKTVFVGDIIKGQNFNPRKPARHIFICDLDRNLNNIEYISQLEQVEYWLPGHGGLLLQQDVLSFIQKEKLK